MPPPPTCRHKLLGPLGGGRGSLGRRRQTGWQGQQLRLLQAAFPLAEGLGVVRSSSSSVNTISTASK